MANGPKLQNRFSSLLSSSWMTRDINEAFDNASSTKNKAYLSKEDYKVAVISLLGYKPTSRDAEEVWHVAKERARQMEAKFRGICREQFQEVMMNKMGALDDTELIHRMFMAFDVPCRGFLVCEDCLRAFRVVLPHIQTKVVEEMFAEVDLDDDGRISYADFEIMLLNSKQM